MEEDPVSKEDPRIQLCRSLDGIRRWLEASFFMAPFLLACTLQHTVAQ